LKCERFPGPSHVDDGGGDALQFVEEYVNPYEEWKRFVCGEPSHQSMEVHQRGSDCWLVREQLEIPHYESQFKVRRREQKQRIRDLEHYLSQEWRFVRILEQIRDMSPGRARDKAVELFWISVHHGSLHPDVEMLERRGKALEGDLHCGMM
jgi:hypothetical protein